MGAANLLALPSASPVERIARPRGRDLSSSELEAFVAELAERPELWIDLVKHDASQRLYEQLLADDHMSAWLICWMDDHDTGFHDHDVSAGAVAVVAGPCSRSASRSRGRRTDAFSARARAFASAPTTSTACATPNPIRRSPSTCTRHRFSAWAHTRSRSTASWSAAASPTPRSCARSRGPADPGQGSPSTGISRQRDLGQVRLVGGIASRRRKSRSSWP